MTVTRKELTQYPHYDRRRDLWVGVFAGSKDSSKELELNPRGYAKRIKKPRQKTMPALGGAASVWYHAVILLKQIWPKLCNAIPFCTPVHPFMWQPSRGVANWLWRLNLNRFAWTAKGLRAQPFRSLSPTVQMTHNHSQSKANPKPAHKLFNITNAKERCSHLCVIQRYVWVI